MATWDVIMYDLNHEVLATFEGDDAEERAKRHADDMDGLALRCYARQRKEPMPTQPLTPREAEIVLDVLGNATDGSQWASQEIEVAYNKAHAKILAMRDAESPPEGATSPSTSDPEG